MADDMQALRGISWRETFPFTHLFRTFRVAIHPSKLLLGLTAMIVLFAGGWVLDTIWPVAHRAVPNEITTYEIARYNPGMDFSAARAENRQKNEQQYAAYLIDYEVVKTIPEAQAATNGGKLLGDLKNAIVKRRNDNAEKMLKKLGDDKVDANRITDAAAKRTRLDQAEAEYVAHRRAEYDRAYANWMEARQIKNEGVFDAFFAYERVQFNGVISSVKHLDWVNGYHSVERFFTLGPVWLLSQHPVYFFLFLILFASVWAVFGGAIARIAAVHVSRDEKLSIRAALRFSSGKFLSFLFAPIIPLMIVAALGIVTTVLAGIVLWAPFIGPIIAGIFFFILLAIGFVMALVLVGTVGGFNLMYPTIAVEGSDSFDAISRSFSYLYARPWRLAFYTAVSIAYGAITYTFIKLFVALMLKLIHVFAGFGVFRSADNMRPLWNTLWPGPGEFAHLTYDVQTLTLGPGEAIGAYLIAVWVYLVIAILGAYAISFYFSSNTIIYYLMRNEVDATDMEDVYVEQQDDELTDSSPSPAAPEATVTEPVISESNAPVASEPAAAAPEPENQSPPAENT